MKITATTTGTGAVRAELLRLGTLAPTALALTAEEVEVYVEGQSSKHTKSGAIFRSIYKRRIGDGWEIGHDPQIAPHALFVHWGTRPHKIRPKTKKALRWAGGGAFSFARGVNHPGYKGDAWMTRAAALAPLAFDRHIAALLARAPTKA